MREVGWLGRRSDGGGGRLLKSCTLDLTLAGPAPGLSPARPPALSGALVERREGGLGRSALDRPRRSSQTPPRPPRILIGPLGRADGRATSSPNPTWAEPAMVQTAKSPCESAGGPRVRAL